MVYKIEIWMDLFETKQLRSINQMLADCRFDERLTCTAPVAVYELKTEGPLPEDALKEAARIFKEKATEALEAPVRVKIIPPAVEA
jgi:hypothetical protein